MVVQVYHVEVKVNDGFKAHVTGATKITRKLPDRLPGAKFPHPKFEKQAPHNGAGAGYAQPPAAQPQQSIAADADAIMGEAAGEDAAEGEGEDAAAARQEAEAAGADVAAAQAELAAAQDCLLYTSPSPRD